MDNGGSQPHSQHPSHRRPLHDLDHQKDADVLFNMNENKNQFEGYRRTGEEEALEDDDLGDQQDDVVDEEVDGDDLEENMEDDY